MKPAKRHKNYLEWFNNLKNRIGKAQIKAALAVNSELINLYWEIGKELSEKQQKEGWGNAIVETLSKDLRKAFPEQKGFSKRNLFYMKSFYLFYESSFEKVQQVVAQIPWGHNILIITKSKDIN